MNWSHRVKATACRLAFIVLLCSGAMLFSQTDSQLKPNQTFGYGENKIVKFSYTQSFDCVDEPLDDGKCRPDGTALRAGPDVLGRQRSES